MRITRSAQSAFAARGISQTAATVVQHALPVVCLGALFLLVVNLSSQPLSNPDTWFHLRIGHELLGPWTLHDPGSLSRFATVDWIPTQWSVQMAAAAFEDWFGLPGVAWLFGVLELVFVATLYLGCRREGDPLPTAIALVGGVFAASGSLSARPQVVSLVLLSLTVAAWLQTSRDLRARWWLVPLTWFWATAHGFWSIGALVGLVCCVGLLLDRRIDGSHLLKLVAVPVLSVVAACLTPVGPALLSAQIAVSERSRLIGEWGPTSFQEMPAMFAAGMFALLIALWARVGGVPWTLLLLMLLAVGLTAYAARMVALGGIIAAPLLSAALQEAKVGLHMRPMKREVLGVMLGMACSAAILAVLVAYTAKEPDNVPTGMTAELNELPTGTTVIVDGPVGAWLEWAFPGLHPTMDGMFDAYQLDYMRDYMDARAVAPGWEHFVDNAAARQAVLNEEGPLARAMVDQLGWRKVAVDEGWILLEAPH